MKKKSASRSAFFNLRVLIGLFIVLAGVFWRWLALARSPPYRELRQVQQKKPKIINIPGLPPGFDCATIHEKGIDRMEGLRCRAHHDCLRRGTGRFSLVHLRAPSPSLSENCCHAPAAYGAADVDLVTGTDTLSNITQSETYTTANPDNPDQIVVAFNDSRGANLTTSPAYRAPPTAAPPSPALPMPAVKAPSRIPLATRLFCTTNQPAHGLPSGSTAMRRLHLGRLQVHHSFGPD